MDSESESESEVAQSCLTLSDPMDCSLLGSSIHGIFRATVLEWGAIAFSHRKHLIYLRTSQVTQCCVGKIPLEKEMAIHSGILAWEIPWTEESGILQSMRVAKQSDMTQN